MKLGWFVIRTTWDVDIDNLHTTERINKLEHELEHTKAELNYFILRHQEEARHATNQIKLRMAVEADNKQLQQANQEMRDLIANLRADNKALWEQLNAPKTEVKIVKPKKVRA